MAGFEVNQSQVNALVQRLRAMAELDDVKEVIRMNGAEMHKEMQRKAPVDTGHMKRTITISMGDSGLVATVKPTADYAPYVEFGTRFQSAQPFVRPSYHKQKQKFINDMKRLVK